MWRFLTGFSYYSLVPAVVHEYEEDERDSDCSDGENSGVLIKRRKFGYGIKIGEGD
jgi:hypothetical protein